LPAGRRDRPHDDRLHDALGADRIGEVFERLRPHVGARLVSAALHHVDRQRRQAFARRGDIDRGGSARDARARRLRAGLRAAAKQRIQTTPQSPSLYAHPVDTRIRFRRWSAPPP
jgi:hypothetical protein